MLSSIVNTVLNYEGFDPSLLSSQLTFTNKIDSILYSSTASLPPLNLQEQIAALYLGIPGRPVDSSGLKYWSTDLLRGTSYVDVINKQLLTPEYQQKVGSLTGDAYIQHVYTLVHGVAATQQQLATYSALGTDKAIIAQAIINDMRSSTATDATTVSQQHAFEFGIGSSLLLQDGCRFVCHHWRG